MAVRALVSQLNQVQHTDRGKALKLSRIPAPYAAARGLSYLLHYAARTPGSAFANLETKGLKCIAQKEQLQTNCAIERHRKETEQNRHFSGEII